MKKTIAVLTLMMVGVLAAPQAHAGMLQNWLGITELQEQVTQLTTDQNALAGSMISVSNILNNIVLYGGLLLAACSAYVMYSSGAALGVWISARRQKKAAAKAEAAAKLTLRQRLTLRTAITVLEVKNTFFSGVGGFTLFIGLIAAGGAAGWAIVSYGPNYIDSMGSMLATIKLTPILGAITGAVLADLFGFYVINILQNRKTITIKEQQLGTPLSTVEQTVVVDTDALAKAMKESALAQAGDQGHAAAI